MKNTFKSIAVIMAALVLGTSCISEANENGGKREEGKKTTIQLRVVTATATRAAGDDVRDAEALEDKLHDFVYVAVCKADGEVEYYEKHDLIEEDGEMKTAAFQITTGDKYFYVFSDPNEGFGFMDYAGKVDVLHQQGITRQTVDNIPFWHTGLSELGELDKPFVNMTLWPVKQTITASTTTVTAEVGRPFAKVTLNPQPSGFTTKMAGEWSDFKFAIGSTPDCAYMIGHYEGTIVPPATGHGKVTSLYHEIPVEGVSIVDFMGYTHVADYKDFNTFKVPYTTENMSCYYIHENTSAKMKSDGTVSADGSLYYGTTTYIKFAATYTPADTEWHNYLNASQAGDIYKHSDGKSFYTAKVNGQTLVFGESPVSTMEGLDESSIRFYENGVNYFHFPIRDRKETALENQCRVLRNHWYDITVNSIDRFGDTNTTVTPSEPVDEEIELDVLIKVLKWASVSQSENL